MGSEVAGLACATRLAAGGRAVTLFERSHRVGGRVSTRVAGALSFNHGAQACRSHPVRGCGDMLITATGMAKWSALRVHSHGVVIAPRTAGPCGVAGV